MAEGVRQAIKHRLVCIHPHSVFARTYSADNSHIHASQRKAAVCHIGCCETHHVPEYHKLTCNLCIAVNKKIVYKAQQSKKDRCKMCKTLIKSNDHSAYCLPSRLARTVGPLQHSNKGICRLKIMLAALPPRHLGYIAFPFLFFSLTIAKTAQALLATGRKRRKACWL